MPPVSSRAVDQQQRTTEMRMMRASLTRCLAALHAQTKRRMMMTSPPTIRNAGLTAWCCFRRGEAATAAPMAGSRRHARENGRRRALLLLRY